MQSKQYFTKIKNYPHEKSTEPILELFILIFSFGVLIVSYREGAGRACGDKMCCHHLCIFLLMEILKEKW